MMTLLEPASLLNQMTEGVYATDTDRRIVYWNAAAERITGYSAEEVIGRQCRDNILMHETKDGKRLCGFNECPMYRAICTCQRLQVPMVVYARHKDGHRIPLHVSVAPYADETGAVVGGIEVFRDLSTSMFDYERARDIQRNILPSQGPDDPRLELNVIYQPTDMVGGDFYAWQQIDEDRYAVLVADVTGHGVSAALYTMYLRILWLEQMEKFTTPTNFLINFSQSLRGMIGRDFAFATAALAVVDFRTNKLKIAGAGAPPVFVFRPSGRVKEVGCIGLPLGLTDSGSYHMREIDFHPGDVVLLYTDGAFEVTGCDGHEIGIDGFRLLLQKSGYPGSRLKLENITRRLLDSSQSIILKDDVTLLEMRLNP